MKEEVSGEVLLGSCSLDCSHARQVILLKFQDSGVKPTINFRVHFYICLPQPVRVSLSPEHVNKLCTTACYTVCNSCPSLSVQQTLTVCCGVADILSRDRAASLTGYVSVHSHRYCSPLSWEIYQKMNMKTHREQNI